MFAWALSQGKRGARAPERRCRMARKKNCSCRCNQEGAAVTLVSRLAAPILYFLAAFIHLPK